jgi:hypothetical protein
MQNNCVEKNKDLILVTKFKFVWCTKIIHTINIWNMFRYQLNGDTKFHTLKKSNPIYSKTNQFVCNFNLTQAPILLKRPLTIKKVRLLKVGAVFNLHKLNKIKIKFFIPYTCTLNQLWLSMVVTLSQFIEMYVIF